MEMFTHSCIKCSTQYQDGEPDAYYCESCIEEKKKIAAQIDANLSNRPKRPTTSALQEFDSLPKVHGNFVQVRL